MQTFNVFVSLTKDFLNTIWYHGNSLILSLETMRYISFKLLMKPKEILIRVLNTTVSLNSSDGRNAQMEKWIDRQIYQHRKKE